MNILKHVDTIASYIIGLAIIVHCEVDQKNVIFVDQNVF